MKVPAVPSSVKRLARSSRISLRWGATLAKLRAGQHFVLFDRDVMGLGDRDDLRANGTLPLGDDPGRTGLVVVQRDRKLVLYVHAHSARSRKCPAGAGADAGGVPSRITMSPG